MRSAGYQTEVARTQEDVEALRDAWSAMPSRIDADIDFFLRFVEVHRDFVARPHVIVLREGSRIVSILPGRLERQSLKVRVGYKDIALPKVNQITFVGQLLGENCKEAAAEILKSAQSSLRQKEADVLFFHQVDSQDLLHETVAKAGGCFTRDYSKESEENWRTQISSDYKAFLICRSSNTRYNIKRYSKRLLQAYPGKVRHQLFRNSSDMRVIFRDCESIAAQSYHRGLGVGFSDDEASRQIFALAADHGWLRSYILYIDDRPAAFWNGFLYRGTFLIWNTAYDTGLSELRAGLYLLQRVVEDLCASGAVHELDFGTGSAQYKRDMCETSSLSVSQFVFAPTLKGVCLNALRTPPLVLSRAAKWVLKQSGFLDKARRIWRSRLSATASGERSRQTSPAGENREG